MSPKLTLDDERRMLDEIRGWPRVSGEDFDGLLEERLGVAWLDQLRAARDETASALRSLQGTRGFSHTAAHPAELLPLIAAGVFRCMAGSRCKHAALGDRPLFALLAARVIACRPCLPRYRDVLLAHDLQVAGGADSLCDFCLTEREGFFPTSLSFGPVLLFGDMCDRCREQAEADTDPEGGDAR